MVKSTRAPAFMQDRARAKKLTIAPIEISTPIHFMPRFSLRVVSGASSWSSGGVLPASACVSTYVMKTKNAPVSSRLAMTARGMVISGLRASSPKAVAHSKPTRLKIATTTPRPMSFIPWPVG